MRGKAPIRFGSTAQPKAQSLYRPLSEPLAIVFSKEVPKPDCLGSVTGGPPRSCHLKLRLLLLSSAVIVHATVTLPSSVHGAPYFAALVASSWTASEKFCAYCALTITSMPSIFIRSRYGSSSSSTISFKSTPLQFALVSSRLLRAKACRRSSKAFLAVANGYSPERLLCAMD